jgi:uncharacterized protein
MRIRDLTPDDLDAALELNNHNVPAVNELDAPEIARLVRICHTALTAEVDVDGTWTFAGFCLVFAPGADYASLNYRWFSQHYMEFAYLDRIAVDTTFRRYGIGRGFYAELQQRLPAEFPVLCCEVNVRPMNQPSIDFHRTIGFREVGQQDTDGGNKTVSLLELQLR